MIPPVSTTKSKTDFSINWIVKDDVSAKKNNSVNNNNTISNNKNSFHHLPMDYDAEISKALRLPPSQNTELSSEPEEFTSGTMDNTLSPPPPAHQLSPSPPQSNQRHLSPSPQPHHRHQQEPIRPMPMIPTQHLPPHQRINNMQMPTDLQSSLNASMHQHSEMVAAQLQLAAAIAHRQQFSIDAKYGQPPIHLSQLMNPNYNRTTYPVQPWLINRHGRIFPHGFAGDFLLHPFRKPKRIRTAFAPLQLLKLEHAFEGNQYVVGTERKALAKNLNLSETQVKVWFQNRRTKHKRMSQEESCGKGGGGGGGSDDDSIGRKTSSYHNTEYNSDIEINMDDSNDEDNL